MPWKVRSRAPKMLRESPKWVKRRKPHNEHMFSGMPRIVLGHGAQHCGFVRTADKDLAEEFPRVNRFQAGEAMVARHQDDQRLVVHYLVAQVEGRLDAQEGHVEPAAGERLGDEVQL